MIEYAPIETEIWTDSYHTAKFYCFSLNIDGKIGWRLPTAEELRYIAETSTFDKWAWYWCEEDEYLQSQNLSVRAVRTIDNP